MAWGKYFFFLLLFLGVVHLWAQVEVDVHIQRGEITEAWLQKELSWKSSYPSDTSFHQALQQLIDQLHERSFLEASIDDLQRIDSSTVQVDLHIGPAFQWVVLQPGNVLEEWLGKAGYREKLYANKPFSFPEVERLKNALLEVAENNGYPFAKVQLTDIHIQKGQISAQLTVQKDSLILMNHLKMEGEEVISSQYLSNYLGLLKDTPYNRSKILKIKDRLKELPFLSLVKDPIIVFSDNRAQIVLELEKKRSSRFDFVIGVLPDPNGRLLITGDFKGELYNQFGRGERIYGAFERLKPATQELDLQFNYPYFLQLPFGVDANVHLYKQDSAFIELTYDIGVQYLMEGGNFLKVFWQNQTANLLTIDTLRILRQERLPENLDYSTNTFGLEWFQQKLDYRINPRKGWSIFLKGAAGRKRIKRNNTISELPIEDLYRDLDLTTFQYQLDSDLKWFIPLFQRSTFLLNFSGGAIISEMPIYRNEQYRIGGNRRLRGFTEQSIQATLFGLSTVEYRLLIGQNSYLNLFGDLAYVEDETNNRFSADQMMGFGAGITFETKAGLFSLSLAYGRTRKNPNIDVGAPKIHFGYVSLF